MGFSDVMTYIQSGNIVFNSGKKDMDKLAAFIEKELSAEFDYKAMAVLVSHQQMKKIMKEIPEGFGTEPGKYKYDVIFLKEPHKPGVVLPEIRLREGVDAASAGTYTLYFSRLIDRAGQSYLKNVMALPVYRQMTIRNWNTTRKLFELMNCCSEEGAE